MRHQVLQEVEKVNKNKQLEYKKLDKEMVEREKKIIKKWKETNPHMIIGECNTPEMKALTREWYDRFMEIKEKYKDEK